MFNMTLNIEHDIECSIDNPDSELTINIEVNIEHDIEH